MKNMFHLEFVATVIFFCGLAYLHIYSRNQKQLKGEAKFIVFMWLLGTILAYWDAVALRWGAYQYNPLHTLNTKILGGELDTYLFMGAVTVVASSATLVYLKKEVKVNAKRSRRLSDKSYPRKRVYRPAFRKS